MANRASRVDYKLLKWFGHVARMAEGVDGGSNLSAGTVYSEVRLDGWCSYFG